MYQPTTRPLDPSSDAGIAAAEALTAALARARQGIAARRRATQQVEQPQRAA